MGNQGALKDITKGMLEELYWGQRLNCRQIGEMFGLTAEAILWRMRKYDIPARDIHECHKGIGLGHPCYFNRKGMSTSEETRRKIAQSNTGKPSPMRGRRGWSHGLTKETHPSLAKMAEKLKGENNPNFGRLAGEHNPMSGKHHSEEAKRKIGDAQRGAKNHRFGKECSEAEKAVLREKGLQLAQNPEYLAILSQKSKELWQDPAFRAARILEMKRMWQDPEHVAKVMRSLHIKPNKIERKLIEILNEHLPEFKYNGDFSLGVTLGGLIPDFVNVNGKKEVIELFGNYWHSKEGIEWHRTELGRIMRYNSIGFRCLIIWDSELKDKPQLLEKIKEFSKRREAHHGRGQRDRTLNAATVRIVRPPQKTVVGNGANSGKPKPMRHGNPELSSGKPDKRVETIDPAPARVMR